MARKVQQPALVFPEEYFDFSEKELCLNYLAVHLKGQLGRLKATRRLHWDVVGSDSYVKGS